MARNPRPFNENELLARNFLAEELLKAYVGRFGFNGEQDMLQRVDEMVLIAEAMVLRQRQKPKIS